MGVHIGHIIFDGMIDSEAVRTKFPEETDALPDGGMLDQTISQEAYWAMHTQPKDAWTFEMDIRPSVESW